MSAKKAAEAHIVRVKIEEGKTGLYYATSPDLKGLLVAEPNIPDLEKNIPVAIADLFRACGESVIVSRVEDGIENTMKPWVAFPVEIAKRELALH